MKKRVLSATSSILAVTLMSNTVQAANISIKNAPEFRVYNAATGEGGLSVVRTNPNSINSSKVIFSLQNAQEVSVDADQLSKDQLIGDKSAYDTAKKATLTFVAAYGQLVPTGVTAFYVTTQVATFSATSGIVVGLFAAITGANWVFNYVDTKLNKELYNELNENGDLKKIGEGITALLKNEDKTIEFSRVEAFNALSNIMANLNKTMK